MKSLSYRLLRPREKNWKENYYLSMKKEISLYLGTISVILLGKVMAFQEKK